MIMASGFRKVVLTAHITSSIGWFGAVAGFLALSIAGLTSQDAQMGRAAYLVMGLTTWFVIVPLAIASLLTGIVSSLGTRWGLFRYYWVLIKLLTTILATLILLVHTQPIDLLVSTAARSTVLNAHLYRTQIQMVIASSGTLIMLLVLTALSVYKPRGMTRYGWQKQQEQLLASAIVDVATDQTEEIVQSVRKGKL
jgi:hypothetical protein